MQMDHVFSWRDKESTDSIHNNEYLVEQKIYDKYGFDQYGFDEEGFDRDGFDLHGINRWGFDEYGDDARFPFRDKDGFDRDGYDRDGYNRQGRDWLHRTREEAEKEAEEEAAWQKEQDDAFNRWKEEQYEEDLNSMDYHIDYERIAYGYDEDDELNEYGQSLYEDDPYKDGLTASIEDDEYYGFTNYAEIQDDSSFDMIADEDLPF